MTEDFWVATELSRPGVFCRDRAVLCCDKVGQNRENFCHDRGFLGRERAGHNRKLCRPR